MSSLLKGVILLAVILAIGFGLVIWKGKVAGHSTGFNSISKQEVEMLLADVAKTNPMVLKRFKDDPEVRKQQLDSLKQLLAFASAAQKDGLANESPNKDELENIRDEVVAVNYDKEKNKDKAMPPFGLITDDQIKAFWGEGPQPTGFWANFKNKIGLGSRDNNVDFDKFLDTKIAILKRDNPQMKDREIKDEERKQAKEFYAKIKIYDDEYAAKVSAGEIPKEVQEKVDLQVKLQQAQYLARLYSETLADKVKATDEEIAKYISEHPDLDPAPKKAKAEEILNRAKNGEDFAALADQYSEDPGNNGGKDGKKRGGLYENVRTGQMVKPFEDAALSLQPGQIYPTLVETDFGFHIIKLDSKKDADPNDKDNPGATYSVRHILISTGFQDPTNPSGRPTPLKQYVAAEVEKEKQKKLIDQIVAENHVSVPDDFDVPEVTDQQIQDSLKQQMQQEQPEGNEPPPPAQTDAKKPEPKKPEPKKK